MPLRQTPPTAALILGLFLAGCVTVTLPAGNDRLAAAPWPASASCPLPADAGVARAQVLAAVNAVRVAAGLAAVVPDAGVAAVAQHEACDDAARQSLDHRGSDGADLMTRLRRGGLAPRLAAENIGLGYADAAAAIAGWMASAPHRANILRPGVVRIGLGLARPPGGQSVWVLDLMAP